MLFSFPWNNVQFWNCIFLPSVKVFKWSLNNQGDVHVKGENENKGQTKKDSLFTITLSDTPSAVHKILALLTYRLLTKESISLSPILFTNARWTTENFSWKFNVMETSIDTDLVIFIALTKADKAVRVWKEHSTISICYERT